MAPAQSSVTCFCLRRSRTRPGGDTCFEIVTTCKPELKARLQPALKPNEHHQFTLYGAVR